MYSMHPNKILKSVKEIIANSLSDVFNASIQTKIFPNDFKIARVTPIFKGGEAEDIGKLQAYLNSCISCQNFEKLLYKQLFDFLSKSEILNSQQWGFRSLHSTALALQIVLDKGETNLTVFLDIKKAFNTTDHEILLNKLNYYGIFDTELQVFESYLCNRKQCCNINGYKSSVKTIKYGVPQGSILEPLPFIIYMNDLPKCIDNAHITVYADDTSSSTTVKGVLSCCSFAETKQRLSS